MTGEGEMQGNLIDISKIGLAVGSFGLSGFERFEFLL